MAWSGAEQAGTQQFPPSTLLTRVHEASNKRPRTHNQTPKTHNRAHSLDLFRCNFLNSNRLNRHCLERYGPLPPDASKRACRVNALTISGRTTIVGPTFRISTPLTLPTFPSY